jgi:hypothetical protein
MPQAEDASAYVYEGVWTNWTKGRHLGATLTLSPQNALLVISIVAIFVQLSGTQLWNIIQFILHQLRATPEDRDGLYHQQQVVLRNSSSELGALWGLLRVAFAWRTQKKAKSYRRSAPLISLAFMHFAFFAMAGVFSSRLLDAGDEVLSRSPFCGDLNLTYWDSLGTTTVVGSPNRLANEYSAHAQVQYQRSQQYVQFCTGPVGACRELPEEKLPSNWTVKNYCPFAPEVCSQDFSKSVVIDTGLISSHRHLGLNAPEADRVQYRKVTTCTVLNDAKHISDWKDIEATPNSPAKRVVDAYYGPNPIADRNATYSYSEWSQYYSYDQYSNTNPYQLNVQQASAADTTGQMSDFIAIPELARTDADVIMFFLSFSKVYDAPVGDPWFSAQQATSYPTHDNINVINQTVYMRERPVTTLACAEQHQLCVRNDAPSAAPDPDRCTPLSGWYQTRSGPDGADSLNLTARQVAVATRVFQAATDSSFYLITSALSQRDTPLLARRSIQGLLGLRLPDDQWLKETLYWNQIAMTHLQRSVIDYGTGQFAADTSYINTTLSTHSRWLCQNQIIRGTIYQSFNLFTMIIVLVFGTLIIIAGYTIEDCVALSRKREQCGDRGFFRRDMWVANEMLEMMSMLYTWRGHTIWSHSSSGIPVSAPGQTMKIGDLDVSHGGNRDRSERGLQEKNPHDATEEKFWRSHLTTSSSPNTPLSSRRNGTAANASSSNTFVFGENDNSEPAKAWDDHVGMQAARSRGTEGLSPHVVNGDDQHRQSEPQRPTAWGESPRTPPLAPLSPLTSWYGQAY